MVRISAKNLILVACIALVTYLILTSKQSQPLPEPQPTDIATFEECVAAGFPVMETYPEQCRTDDGRTFTRIAPIDVPTPIAVSGKQVCLPKKDTGGPVTLECAIGLQADDGYYALDTSAMKSENYPVLDGAGTITVEGMLVPIEQISSDRWDTYDVKGIIAVERITKE